MSLSTDPKTYTLLTFVYNDADDTDDADDYNRVIGIAWLKAFSCAKKGILMYHLRKFTEPINGYHLAKSHWISTK